jgi:F-type H+-transporting ATPase subunit epsilon
MAEPQSKETFNFELVSPERRLIAEPATMAVIPGEEGDFGVLPNHSAQVASIRPGVVQIFSPDQAGPRRIFIAGGFADVSAHNCTVLAEEAVNVSDLNQADLEQTLRNLREDLGLAKDEAERARIQRRVRLTQAKLEAVTGRIVI